MEINEITNEKKEAIIDRNFPLAAKYDPVWQLENEMGGPCLWLLEALTRKMHLQPGMKILDLGCGNAISSIFLAKEFGVQVFATDRWVKASENQERIQAANVEHLVFPINADAHSMPYAEKFFDAAICVNAYQFFGTADTYFSEHLGKLMKIGSEIGFALFGIYHEFEMLVPDYLQKHWPNDFYFFHSLDWWKRHFIRCGSVDIVFADDFDGDGNEIAMKWEPIPDRMKMVRIDAGRNFSWFRLIIKKR